MKHVFRSFVVNAVYGLPEASGPCEAAFCEIARILGSRLSIWKNSGLTGTNTDHPDRLLQILRNCQSVDKLFLTWVDIYFYLSLLMLVVFPKL